MFNRTPKAQRVKIQTVNRMAFKKQLDRWSFSILFVFSVMIALLLVMMLYFNRQYHDSLQNANVAAEFNNDFKKKLDLEMYYYVVGARDYQTLPQEDIVQATEIVTRLKETTTDATNHWRLQSMVNLLTRLDEVMVELSETKGYDNRMISLENNIYIITDLIETYMNDYIYDELQVLANIQKVIQGRTLWVIGFSVVTYIIVFFALARSANRFTSRMVSPIKQLIQKVQQVGSGDFSSSPITTDNEEFSELDQGVDLMSQQIEQLMTEMKEEQELLRKTEFELMQTQINPHFLYNTLDSIIWLAESKQEELVIQMVSSLAEFFRTSLSNGKDIINLETEMKQVESYLKIQKIRYNDVLEYSISLDPSLYRYKIPKLSLQPLVENALYHGIKLKRGKGHIRITGEQEQDQIVIRVWDNGIGISQEKLEILKGNLESEMRLNKLGLLNVQQRLRLYFLKDSGLSFESVEGEWFEVQMRFPKINH